MSDVTSSLAVMRQSTVSSEKNEGILILDKILNHVPSTFFLLHFQWQANKNYYPCFLLAIEMKRMHFLVRFGVWHWLTYFEIDGKRFTIFNVQRVRMEILKENLKVIYPTSFLSNILRTLFNLSLLSFSNSCLERIGFLLIIDRYTQAVGITLRRT